MGTIQVFLEAEAQRVNCPVHGPTVRRGRPGLDTALGTPARSTSRWPGWRTQCSKTAITELMRIAWRTVGAIITRVWADTAAGVDAFAGLRRIGIDEISYKRRHKYLTVVVDHDSGRLVWAASRPRRTRDRARLRRAGGIGTGRCAQITHVSADGADMDR